MVHNRLTLEGWWFHYWGFSRGLGLALGDLEKGDVPKSLEGVFPEGEWFMDIHWRRCSRKGGCSLGSLKGMFKDLGVVRLLCA